MINIRRYVPGEYDPRSGPVNFTVEHPSDIAKQPFIRNAIEEEGYVLKFTDDFNGRMVIMGECQMTRQRKIIAVVEGVVVDVLKKYIPYIPHTLATVAERNRVQSVEVNADILSSDILEAFMDIFTAAIRHNDYRGVSNFIREKVLNNSVVYIGYTILDAMKFSMSLNTRGNGVELRIKCWVHAYRNGTEASKTVFSQEVDIVFGTMPHAEKKVEAVKTPDAFSSMDVMPITSAALHNNLKL